MNYCHRRMIAASLSCLMLAAPAQAKANVRVKSAGTAISVARQVCAALPESNKPGPAVKWTARLTKPGMWNVSGYGYALFWGVDVPVNGPSPVKCETGFADVLPVGTPHEIDCMHLLLPDCPNQPRRRSSKP